MKENEPVIYFQTTWRQCMEKIGDVVCDGCGGILTPIQTVNNAGEPTHWIGCEHCSCFTNGVERRVWVLARIIMTVDRFYDCKLRYMSENDAGRFEWWLNTETRELSRLVKRTKYLLDYPEEKPLELNEIIKKMLP